MYNPLMYTHFNFKTPTEHHHLPCIPSKSSILRVKQTLITTQDLIL